MAVLYINVNVGRDSKKKLVKYTPSMMMNEKMIIRIKREVILKV
jgi:hypothetical protein